MTMKLLILSPLLVLAMAGTAEARIMRDLTRLDLVRAEQTMNKGGFELKAIYNNTGNLGFLMGGQGVSFLNDNFYMGGAGAGGPLNSGGVLSGGFAYGGLVAGYEGKLLQALGMDLHLLVGGGAGAFNIDGSSLGGSFVLEPTLSFSPLLGTGVRPTFSLGYLYAPGAHALSGATVSMRFDFKQLTTTLGVDD